MTESYDMIEGVVSGNADGVDCSGTLPDFYTFVAHEKVLNTTWGELLIGKTQKLMIYVQILRWIKLALLGRVRGLLRRGGGLRGRGRRLGRRKGQFLSESLNLSLTQKDFILKTHVFFFVFYSHSLKVQRRIKLKIGPKWVAFCGAPFLFSKIYLNKICWTISAMFQ